MREGEKKLEWSGMKTVGELRRERNMRAPVKEDSFYKPVQRREFHSEPLVIPKKLQKELPYEFKPKLPVKKSKVTENPLIAKHTAVILEPKESKVRVHALKYVLFQHESLI